MHNENVHAQLSRLTYRSLWSCFDSGWSSSTSFLLWRTVSSCFPRVYALKNTDHAVSCILSCCKLLLSEIRFPYIGYYCSTWRNCCVQIIVQYNKIKNARQGMVLGLLVFEFMLIGVKLGLWVLSGCSANFTQPKIVVVFEHPGTSRNGVSGCINQSQSAVRC